MVQIEAGRHPIIDLLLGEGEQYVPNDTNLSVRLLMYLPITTVLLHAYAQNRALKAGTCM